MKTTVATTRKTPAPSTLSTAEALEALAAARGRVDEAQAVVDERKIEFEAALVAAKLARATNEELKKASGLSVRGMELARNRHKARQAKSKK